jgi:hypothetical protein
MSQHAVSISWKARKPRRGGINPPHLMNGQRDAKFVILSLTVLLQHIHLKMNENE